MCMYQPRTYKCTKSPWGPDDQKGRLNWITDETRAQIMASIEHTKYYDLSVDYFVGMPSWKGAGDPSYQIWMTHTPQGNYNDNLMKNVSQASKELCSYSGDAFSMYTHTGTHLDAFNHFGYRGEIWNGFNEKDDLGSRVWRKCGIEQFPPFIVARAVMLDIAALKGVDCLPDSYVITVDDLKAAMELEQVEIRKGDIVMIRTGRMSVWPDCNRYEWNTPGIEIHGAEFLTGLGGMILASDNIALEVAPSIEEDNYFPVHSYLFSEVGASILELLWLEELSKDRIYEGGVIMTVMPLVGATAAPVQPMFFPFRK